MKLIQLGKAKYMEKIETDAKRKYNDNSTYAASTVSVSLFDVGLNFSSKILAEKRELLLPKVVGKRVLDLGCGNGRHLADLAPQIAFGVGIDFSVPFVQFANKSHGADNLRFVVADARCLPLASETVDCAYSFSAMYNIDDVDDVYAELERVLVPGGIALLELGNSLSLSSFVSRRYLDWAHHSRRTISQHRRALRRHRLNVTVWRSFQLLPMWGGGAWWVRVLRSKRLENMMMRQLGGHMWDEWISSLPGIRHLAFRHLLVCAKG